MEPLPIKAWPRNEQPRERLLHSGARHLSDTELLAILLGRGIPGLSAVELARSLLQRFGSLRGILCAAPVALQQVHGIGPGKTAQLLAT